MNYQDLEKHISQPRLQRFLVATGNSKTKSKLLYRVNLKTSQSFYPVLNLFETVLRNNINENLTIHFSDADWIINEKTRFMADSSLTATKFFLQKSVDKAQRTLRRKGKTVTSGKVIAEQSLGFWTTLFDPHHYKLIGGAPIHCFPNKPSSVNRKKISQLLNHIREFRNRVYHNEPICFKNSSIDFTEAQRVREEIRDLINWIDPTLLLYMDSFDTITTQIQAAKAI